MTDVTAEKVQEILSPMTNEQLEIKSSKRTRAR